MLTLHGLKTCDTCRTALKALAAAGHDVTFRDVRAEPLEAATIARFLDAFGEDLVNRRSTTWRGLSETERGASSAELLTLYPTLMKRPVIERDGQLWLGWSKDVQAALL